MAAGILAAGVAPVAHAADGPKEIPRGKIATTVVTKGQGKWSVSSDDFAKGRQKAREDRAAKKETRSAAGKRAQFLSKAAERGDIYRSEDIDVVTLLDGEVEVAIPKEAAIDSLTVEVKSGEVTVDSGTSNADQDAARFGGPGMAPYWSHNGSGQYILTVKGIGDALFLWKREKLASDGSGSYDFYQYSRKAIAHPYSVDWLPDPKVSKLRVQSYPYDSIEPGLVNWESVNPATSFSGNCDSSLKSVSVTAPVFGAGYTFKDCDDYVVWRNFSNPGSYHITMDQGFYLGSGDREAAYSLSIKVKQGTAGSMHDFQRVIFYFNSEDWTCDSYDSYKTCSG